MAQSEESRRQAVVVVSSHVVRGSVGNRAIVFALEQLGFPVWAVPSVVLGWHPGHGPATRIVPPPRDFGRLLADLAGAEWLGEVGGVISGYLGDASQAEAVAALVGAVKARNPEAIYLCDPVIGEAGGLYVPRATAEAIRDRLLPVADIATPNRYELEWLSGGRLAATADLIAAAKTIGPACMLVTSAPGTGPASIGNLLAAGDRTLLAEHEMIERPPHGSGDLLSALIMAHLLGGASQETALRKATASVFEVLARAKARHADELMLERDRDSLVLPQAAVRVTRLDADGTSAALPPVAGIDGCKAGWVAVFRAPDGTFETFVEESFSDLVARLPAETVIAVDMPIGLPERSGHGGRGPEALVRRRLGARQSSVFSIPSRAAIYAEPGPFASLDDWYAAHRRASDVARATSEPQRGISIQAFGIFSKIRELDQALIERPALRRRVIESHPEAAFWRLNGEAPMERPKKIKGRLNRPGMEERRALLIGCGMDEAFLRGNPPRGAAEDDFLDAAAVLFIAERFAEGLAVPFPDPPGCDSFGNPVAIWT